MNHEIEVITQDIATREVEMGVIDPDMRRDEIEAEIGKNRSDAFFSFLSAMHDQGNDENLDREIFHNAYFPSRRKARKFGEWLTSEGYKLLDIWRVRKSRIRVDFSNVGKTTLDAMLAHQRVLPGAANTFGGFYDGWLTKVEPSPITPEL